MVQTRAGVDTTRGNRWSKQELEWIPPGRIKTGRHGVRWMERIQDGMAERGMEESGQMERNGDWESEDVSDENDTYMHLSIHTISDDLPN
jgi:hypothetical protein